jgi:hypothetical protein
VVDLTPGLLGVLLLCLHSLITICQGHFHHGVEAHMSSSLL